MPARKPPRSPGAHFSNGRDARFVEVFHAGFARVGGDDVCSDAHGHARKTATDGETLSRTRHDLTLSPFC